jgi:hypothetical protein
VKIKSILFIMGLLLVVGALWLQADSVFGIDKAHPWEGVKHDGLTEEPLVQLTPTELIFQYFASLECRASGGTFICRYILNVHGIPEEICVCVYKNLK